MERSQALWSETALLKKMNPLSSRLKRLGRLKRCESGVSAVEFAIITPLLLTMLLGLLDYSIALFHKMELISSLRAGSQYALIYGTDTTSIESAVTNSSNLDSTNLTLTVSEVCECQGGTTVTCTGGTCSAGSVQHFIQIDGTYVYTPIFLPGSLDLTSSSTIRVQ